MIGAMTRYLQEVIASGVLPPEIFDVMSSNEFADRIAALLREQHPYTGAQMARAFKFDPDWSTQGVVEGYPRIRIDARKIAVASDGELMEVRRVKHGTIDALNHAYAAALRELGFSVL